MISHNRRQPNLQQFPELTAKGTLKDVETEANRIKAENDKKKKDDTEDKS